MIRTTTLRTMALAAALLGAGCSEAPRPGPTAVDARTVRLIAATVATDAGAALAALADRDTTTSLAFDAPIAVRLRFEHDVEIRELRVHGDAVELSAPGFPAAAATGAWASSVAAAPVRAVEFVVTLRPTGPGARVSELEPWGGGLPLAPRGAEALANATRDRHATFENARVARATPAEATLDPAGLQRGDSCVRARVDVPGPRAARRAFLAYEANVQRPVVLSRSLDGEAPVGGFWLGATGERRTIADELDPERLTGSDEVLLCLPPDATGSVRIEGLRVVLLLDDGVDPFDRDAHAALPEALDGADDTAATLAGARVELGLDRPTSLRSAELRVSAAPARLAALATRAAGAWSEGGPLDLDAAATALPLDGRTADALALELAAPARPELPAGRVSELSITGSGVGPRVGAAHLVLTYPAVAPSADGRLVGERFGARAFVQGWAESPAGAGVVEIGGATVSVAGAFAAPLSRSASSTGPWLVVVRARFPDGSELSRTIDLADDRAAELAGTVAQAPALGDDVRFGRENETAYGAIDAAGGKVTLGSDVFLDAPAGAVSGRTSIGIGRKGPEQVPPLDAGMVNVTAPPQGGYRFLPKGQQFARPVRIGLPYDPALLPEGVTPQEIRTYWYDEAADEWKALPRVEVQTAATRVVSETTHFTFMVNAVLVLPDHPGPTSFNPTSLKDLKAADPSAGIDLVEAPEPNNQGTAQLGLPIRLPKARGAYQPELRISYDSGGANGWVGVGWDVAVPSVQVDTRFGVPFYEGEERYLVDGEEMVPVEPAPLAAAERCEDGTAATLYRARVERSFRRVRRCGTLPTNYWWEATDKAGTVFVYGREDARLARPGSGEIGQWFLERVIDANGNLAQYAYEKDELGTTDPLQREGFVQLYLHTIRYSGRASRLGDAATFGKVVGDDVGAYVVELRSRSGASGLEVRKDVITSARLGFKVETRRRLGSILVRLEPKGAAAQTIREYRLDYEEGSFGKSRLSRVGVYGAGEGDGRKLFHEHRFSYTDADLAAPFEAAQPWAFPSDGDELPLTRSEATGSGKHAYFGIGALWDKITGSVGVRYGSTSSKSKTKSVMIDVNGDGLPDRVALGADGIARVQFNQGGGRTIEPLLPPGDPGAGDRVPTLPLTTLGRDSSSSTNKAFQAGAGIPPASIWANVGVSSSWSESDQFLLDADGDGRVDVVTSGGILLNQPRNEQDLGFAWAPRAGLEEIATEPSADDADAGAIADSTKEVPSSPVLEWMAPYQGTVDVSGSLAFARALTSAADPRWDGVRLTVYRADYDWNQSKFVTTTLGSFDKKRAQLSQPTLVTLPGQQVYPGTRIVFVLSTLGDFPVDFTGPTPLEETTFMPVIAYRGADRAVVDATGAPTHVFDAARDFRLAGEPMGAVNVPVKGTIRVRSTVSKKASTDAVVLCIQKFAPDASLRSVRCGEPAAGVEIVAQRTYAADATVPATVLEDVIAADGGAKLVFRVDSDLPVDPGAITWSVDGEMTSICDAPGGGCRAPDAEDDEYARFVADAYVPLHLPVKAWTLPWAKLPPSPEPTPAIAWTAPADGNYDVYPVQDDGWLGQDRFRVWGATRPVFISARTPSKVLFKARTDAVPPVRTFWLAKGERVFFEIHSEEDFGANWRPAIVNAGATPDFDHGPPVNLTFCAVTNGDRKDVLWSIFAGGFHGWRYGVWRSAEPYDAAKVAIDPAKYKTGDDQTNQGSAESLQQNGDDTEKLKLAAPLLPRSRGTWWSREKVGLKPFVPAFVTPDGATFVTAGGMHASRENGFVETPEGATTAGAAFAIGGSVRKSGGSSTSVSAGASVGPLGFNGAVAWGATSQRSDLIDVNGDRIVDVVSGNGSSEDVRITGITDLRPRDGHAMGVPLRKNSDVTVSAGLGVSNPWTKLDPEDGIIKAVVGMFPMPGLGAGVNLSSTDQELVDVNGDGLPDSVRRDGTCGWTGAQVPGFVVRLNLGGRFGAEDCIPAAEWSRGDLDSLSSSLRRVPGVSASAVSPNRVRRTTAVSLQSNLGFSIGENFAGGANWQSSIAATAVSLADVNGDGLPDYVRKSPADGAFYVMINTGYGFLPERAWRMPEWPSSATKPWISGRGLFGGIGQKLFDKVAGSQFVDAVEVNGTYSAQPNVNFAVSWGVMIGLGTPWLHFTVGWDKTLKEVSGYQLGMMDIDGDGLADHVLKAEAREGGSNRDVWVRRNALGGANLLKRVDRPLGGAIDLHYARTGNTVLMPESRWVLDWTEVHDGRGPAGYGEVAAAPGHELRTDIEYGIGRYDRAEREFLGFDEVRLVNRRYDGEKGADGLPKAIRKVVRTFDNERHAFKGLLQTERLLDGDGRLWTETVNGYAKPYADARFRFQDGEAACDAHRPYAIAASRYWCGSMFPALESVTTRRLEGHDEGITTEQRFQYDGVGNVIAFDDLGDASAANTADDVHAVVQYSSDGAAVTYRSVSRPFQIEIADARGRLLRKRQGFYDARGNLERLVSWVDATRTVDSFLSWTADGTLLESKGPSVDGKRLTYTYGYDPVARTYVERIEDSHGYVSTATYDLRFGEPERTTDLNGNVTRRELDAFGRLWRVFGPYDTTAPTIEVEYGLWAPVAYARTKNRVPDGRTIDTVVLVDGMKRVVETKKTAEVTPDDGDGSTTSIGWSVTGRQSFDWLLRIVRQGQTYFEPGRSPLLADRTSVRETLSEYDLLDRKTRLDEPVEPSAGKLRAVTATTYGFEVLDGIRRRRVEVVDPEQRTMVAFRDIGDRVVAVEEWDGAKWLVTRYAYDLGGALTTLADARGNTTRIEYDLLGRRTVVDAPDTGRVEYVFDAAGNVVEKRTPNLRAGGGAIVYRYDYDQLVAVEHPDGRDVTFEFGRSGAPENGAGRVVRVIDDAGSETRGYGKLGEVVRTTRVVKPLTPGDYDKTFETKSRFDSFGRMLEIVYPDGEKVSYAYDAGGLVCSVVGHRPGTAHDPAETETYLKKMTYDAFGSRRRVELGNGAVSVHRYHADSRRLATLNTTATGRTLQALSYTYDAVGNVRGMTNALAPATGRRSGPVTFTFGYDDLYRLTTATGTAEARTNVTDSFAVTYVYDDVHNMTSNVQEHAIRSITDTGVEVAFPPQTNHALDYRYDGKAPHLATKIGDRLLAYDGNGNTVRECRDHGDQSCTANADQLRRYYWTDEDRLDAVVDGGGQHVTRFVYDAAGQRVAKLGRGGESLTIGQFFALKGRKAASKHVFVGETRIASKLIPAPGWAAPAPAEAAGFTPTSPESVENGCDPSSYQPQKCPVYPGADPVVQHRIDTLKVKPATYYYHAERIGSTSWVTDQHGRVHEHVDYFPYGEVWRDQRSDADGAGVARQQFLFTAKELDEETGLYYSGARYYDARRARWLSPDPADRTEDRVPTVLNPFQYGRWNPWMFVDPTGRREEGISAEEYAQMRRDMNYQADAAKEGLEKIKPYAEALIQLHPGFALHTAATGEQATGGKASTLDRILAVIGIVPVGGVLKFAKGTLVEHAAEILARAHILDDDVIHILTRHGANITRSKAGGVFREGTDFLELIETAVKSEQKVLREDRGRLIVEFDFGANQIIGKNIDGADSSLLRVVLDPDGRVVTAFPF
jgi:RHS repeat-associated protein